MYDSSIPKSFRLYAKDIRVRAENVVREIREKEGREVSINITLLPISFNIYLAARNDRSPHSRDL